MDMDDRWKSIEYEIDKQYQRNVSYSLDIASNKRARQSSARDMQERKHQADNDANATTQQSQLELSSMP